MTIEKKARNRKTFSQIPMLFVFIGTVRFEYFVNCFAFVLILMKLLRSAKSGASGKADENRITKPN